MAALCSFKVVVRQAQVRRQLLLGADISYVIFKEEARAQSAELRRRRRRASLTIVERQMDLDLDEYAPDDCHGLLGS
jgi:hypothetical protein